MRVGSLNVGVPSVMLGIDLDEAGTGPNVVIQVGVIVLYKLWKSIESG